jgi:hypothetical protein
VGSGFDDRVVGCPNDGTLDPIQGYRNLGSLTKQLIKFFLQPASSSIHELGPSLGESVSPERHRAGRLPQIARVLLLTFSSVPRSAQKLTCTRGRGENAVGKDAVGRVDY